MTEYALLIDGVFKEFRHFKPTSPPIDIPHKSVVWYPVTRTIGPTASQGLVGSNWVVRTVDPATLPPAVPSNVTSRQLRLALLSANRLGAVKAMMAQAGEASQIDWEYSSHIARSSPLVASMASTLSMTAAEVDQMFISASTL